ncbi:MAG: lactate utilization protein B [Pseudomonadota bacterium]
MQQRSTDFLSEASRAIQDSEHAHFREALGTFMPTLRDTAVEEFGGDKRFQALRLQFKAVRQHALHHLGHYLAEFAEEARSNGSQVHFARTGAELNQRVLEICAAAKAQRVIKGKSMVTEETALNAALEEAGIAVRETDLGEYIVQTAGETPSHIVGPALHKTEAEIGQQFLDQHRLGTRELNTAPEMVAEARAVLREQFLAADVGIIGANALVAETGYSMLVTNEGNGDLCANIPDTLIVCTTVDRVLPRTTDAMAMLRLLVRSTTGQPITCYTSFYGGPRRSGDTDGPRQVHFILLDNHRSEILASDYVEMLECVRCGACLNHCPVYMSAGGHAYGWVYPGPMGSILTPLLTSLEASSPLPDACTACGRCEAVCPAAIPIPDLLRDLRAEKHQQRITPRRWRWGIALHAWLVQRPRLYRLFTGLGTGFMHRIAKDGVLTRLPLAAGWLSARDLPAPAKETFLNELRRTES